MPIASANSVATISSLPIARHGPKFNTGGIPKDSHTFLSFGPAYLAASGFINPQFSIPPESLILVVFLKIHILFLVLVQRI